MQDYNVLSRSPTEESGDDGEADDPDERDQRSLLPQTLSMNGRYDSVSSIFSKEVSSCQSFLRSCLLSLDVR
jgi:hypothetical protein